MIFTDITENISSLPLGDDYCPDSALSLWWHYSLLLGGSRSPVSLWSALILRSGIKVPAFCQAVSSTATGSPGASSQFMWVCVCVSRSVVPDCLWPQAPLSMGFSRQEFWSGLPFSSPGDLLNPGIEPRSPALQADSLPSEPPKSPQSDHGLSVHGILQPRILEWVAIPFSGVSSWPRNRTWITCITAWFFSVNHQGRLGEVQSRGSPLVLWWHGCFPGKEQKPSHEAHTPIMFFLIIMEPEVKQPEPREPGRHVRQRSGQSWGCQGSLHVEVSAQPYSRTSILEMPRAA